MEQRRDFAGCCCQEDGIGAAQVPGLKLQRQKTLSFWLPLHVGWLLPTTHGHPMSNREGAGPQTALGALRGKIRDHCVFVSCVQVQGHMPPPVWPLGPQHTGVAVVLAQAWATCHTSEGWRWGQCAGPKDGAELVREGRRGAAMAEIGGSHRSSQNPALRGQAPSQVLRTVIQGMCWLRLFGVITYLSAGEEGSPDVLGKAAPLTSCLESSGSPREACGQAAQSTRMGSPAQQCHVCLLLGTRQVEAAESVVGDQSVTISQLHI